MVKWMQDYDTIVCLVTFFIWLCLEGDSVSWSGKKWWLGLWPQEMHGPNRSLDVDLTAKLKLPLCPSFSRSLQTIRVHHTTVPKGVVGRREGRLRCHLSLPMNARKQRWPIFFWWICMKYSKKNWLILLKQVSMHVLSLIILFFVCCEYIWYTCK